MTWTIHQGYLGDPKGLPIADTLIFVKHKERSYEAIALYTGEHRNVYKKDKGKKILCVGSIQKVVHGVPPAQRCQ